jgi:rSAM/selenodomain-associated transferase 1
MFYIKIFHYQFWTIRIGDPVYNFEGLESRHNNKYSTGVETQLLASQEKTSENNKPGNALIVFVRYPEAGKVKTRLAEGTSNEFAGSVYKLCAERIFSEISFLKNFNKYIFYSEEKDKEKIIEWTNNNFFYYHQVGDDLGERMFNAFEFVFNQQNRQAIIVGTDIPDLSKEIILGAIDSLDKNDLVIGPSHDGGYYLLGMKKVHSGLFEDIEWSSNSVFSSTVQKANASNLKIKELQMLRDIDTKNELDNWLLQAGNMELKNKILSLLRKQNLNDH